MTDKFTIVEGYARTSGHINALCDAADVEPDALGFFAKSVYQELAHAGSLLVLERTFPGPPSYAGHLLFSCSFPRATVIQILVLPQYRRQGNADRLLQHLRDVLTRQGFTSIYARVAEDLVTANAFWERQQFYVQREERGGVVKNRRILVRSHELPSPQLFPPSGITSSNPLGLSIPASSDVPLFLLDLNVLFDVMPRRRRHGEVAALFQAQLMNACRLAISDEIKAELRRTSQDEKTDPMLAYAAIFPSFPVTPEGKGDVLVRDLGQLVFPDRALNDSDVSDLRHLATAITHELAGLITSDEQILRASQSIREAYGLQVLSPSAFKMDGSPATGGAFELSPSTSLRFDSISRSDENAFRDMLLRHGIPGASIATTWSPADRSGVFRAGVWKDGAPCGYLSWTGQIYGKAVVSARALVDESHLQASVAGRLLLLHLLEQVSSLGPVQVTLEVPTQQSVLRELALGCGFRGTPDPGRLTKLVLGRVLTKGTWERWRAELSSRGGLKLPDGIPAFRSIDQHIGVLTPDGNRAHVSLDSLETLLGPTLLCLPGRPAVITPILKKYSEALIGDPRQRSLLPQARAQTYRERHYLASPRAFSSFRRGALMFFYESMKGHGRGEVIALGRVRQAYLSGASTLPASLEQSVLTELTLHEIGKSAVKTVAVFDNLFRFPAGVSRDFLERIGCGRPNDLITTRPITDTQVQEILREGFENEA